MKFFMLVFVCSRELIVVKVMKPVTSASVGLLRPSIGHLNTNLRTCAASNLKSNIRCEDGQQLPISNISMP